MPITPINTTTRAIQFINTATTPGVLNGSLTIDHDRQRRDLTAYALYWGNSEKDKIGPGSRLRNYGAENIGTTTAPQYAFHQPLTHVFNNTAAPAAATHLLVFVTDSANQQSLYASRPLVNQQHLLPGSATQMERYLAASTGRLDQIPLLLDSLWDPARCPSQLLPWLAWATSSDIWFDNLNDPVEESIRRRKLIIKSAFVHKYKGTKAAIQQALDAFANVSITLTEWWQQTPRGHPHTFRLDLLVNGNTPGAGTAEFNDKLRHAIDAIKPVRSHYHFTLSIVQTATTRLAASGRAVSYKRFNMSASL